MISEYELDEFVKNAKACPCENCQVQFSHLVAWIKLRLKEDYIERSSIREVIEEYRKGKDQ